MRFDTLTQIEARFRTEAASALTAFSLPVPNENLTLHGQVFKPTQSDYFHAVEHQKERIVLHFTAGNVRSDILSLTQQSRHISVPFVIARDGTIYQLFPSKFWSGHLGEGVGNKKGTGNPQDKATIGIELSNYGYLVPREGNLETIYSQVKDNVTGKTSPIDLYCPLDNKQAYTKIDKPFRNQSHYATFTPEQLDSLIVLLRFLTAKYKIPRKFLPSDKRFIATSDVLTFNGIVSHVNYRESGKWDIGEAFDWNTVIEGVQAAAYVSTAPAARSLDNAITSEEEIEALFPQSKDVRFVEEKITDEEGYNPNDFEDQPLAQKNMKTPRNVYGLLVGINNYEKVRKLSGCINDVEKIEKYLLFDTDFQEKNVIKLTDAQATRKGIADAFRGHLSQAKAEDTVLFYYSGHGTQEEADTQLWKEETDAALECIVCYDGGTAKVSEFLLTDKELRFLINELSEKTKAHIVTIFDCCHSGDNTRNGTLMTTGANTAEVNERRVLDRAGKFFPKREWGEFLFANTISEDTAKNARTTQAFLKQGTHLQMAACESNQSALEVAREGVFTKTLLKTLKDCGGNISYNTLRSRVRQYMRASFEQTPRVYAPNEAITLLHCGFLNHPIDPQKMICEATVNDKNSWQINVGAIHGVKPNSKILLSDPNLPTETFEAKVRENGVFIDYTLIDFAGVDTNAIYKAEVAGLMTQELILKLQNHDATPEEAKQVTEDLLKNASGGFSFGGENAGATTEKDSGEAEKADYTLHLRSGEAYLSLPNDPYRPLILPMPYLQDSESAQVPATFRHISRWHFIKNLQNQKIPDNFPPQPLKIELTRIQADGAISAIDISNGVADLAYEKIEGNWEGTIQIKVTNITTQNLYFCAAYLSKEFDCFLEFVPDRIKLLEPGKDIFLGLDGEDRIELTISKVEQEYNWPQTVEYFKFIVSTTLFDAEALTLETLPQPLTTDDIETPRGKGLDRGLKTRDKAVQFSGWLTQTIQLVFKNPVYNQIPDITLKKLLEWEETSFFAAGLYCDMSANGFGSKEAKIIPKEGITIVVPEDERGLFGDIKMWFGNKIETNQRRKRYNNLKKDPSRIRIVAEGDSWFQYPLLLQDTIDHLYKRYAILSFAEAGDTLANYLTKTEYIKAIGEEGAKFFLVSGGGNDVLGEEFQFFLRESPDPNDTTPKRHLNQKFFDQLTKLKDLYEQMFSKLLTRYKDLHILVHCYDYIIPVDIENPQNKKKSSWSGKYMIEKGIAPQAERENLIRYILDEFAKKLSKLVQQEEFKGKVSFIDTRGLVNRNNWFDEIHPTDAGFQLVADKFMQEIERVRIQKKSL